MPVSQQFTLKDLQKAAYPLCIFDCVQNINNNAFRCSNEQRTSIHQDSRRKPTPNEKSFNTTVLAKSTATQDSSIYLHQTNVICSEIITWSPAPRLKMLLAAEEQKLRAEGTHFL